MRVRWRSSPRCTNACDGNAMDRARRVTLLLRSAAGVHVQGTAPVEEEVECEDGSVRRFTGWLGLVNELERLVAALARSTGGGWVLREAVLVEGAGPVATG